MTLDEAKLILNLKQDVSAAGLSGGEGKTVLEQVRESMVKSYDHLFATNAPPAPKGQKGGGAGSFYIQSKVVRARERIEAEWSLLDAAKKPEADAAETRQRSQQARAVRQVAMTTPVDIFCKTTIDRRLSFLWQTLQPVAFGNVDCKYCIITNLMLAPKAVSSSSSHNCIFTILRSSPISGLACVIQSLATMATCARVAGMASILLATLVKTADCSGTSGQ